MEIALNKLFSLSYYNKSLYSVFTLYARYYIVDIHTYTKYYIPDIVCARYDIDDLNTYTISYHIPYHIIYIYMCTIHLSLVGLVGLCEIIIILPD